MNPTTRNITLLLLSIIIASSTSAQISFNDYQELDFGQYGACVTIADMNNDGRNDLVVVGQSLPD